MRNDLLAAHGMRERRKNLIDLKMHHSRYLYTKTRFLDDPRAFHLAKASSGTKASESKYRLESRGGIDHLLNLSTFYHDTFRLAVAQSSTNQLFTGHLMNTSTNWLTVVVSTNDHSLYSPQEHHYNTCTYARERVPKK